MSTQVPPPAEASPRKSHALRTTLIVIGSVLLLLLLVSVAVNIITALTRTDASGTYTVTEPFETVRVDVDASNVNVSFGNVDEPSITFDQGDSNRAVTFEQEVRGVELRIVAQTRGGFFPFGIWPWGMDTSRLDVVLPAELNDGSLGIAVSSAAGNVSLDGAYDDVTLELTAGNLDLSGSATALSIDATAGDVRVDDYTASDVRIDTTAGNVMLDFAELPDEITASSVAGDQEIVLPDGEYRIETDTTAGEVSIDAPSDPDAARTYSFSTVAGDIRIFRR